MSTLKRDLNSDEASQSNLTKQEAIALMMSGKKVTHVHFSHNEWMTIENNQILLEDGVRCSSFEFWRWRTDPSWDIGYSLFN